MKKLLPYLLMAQYPICTILMIFDKNAYANFYVFFAGGISGFMCAFGIAVIESRNGGTK